MGAEFVISLGQGSIKVHVAAIHEHMLAGYVRGARRKKKDYHCRDLVGRGQTMKLEELKNKTKDAVNYLVQSLESGHSEVLTQYLGAMARFHTYSFGNVMLIARQKSDATN